MSLLAESCNFNLHENVFFDHESLATNGVSDKVRLSLPQLVQHNKSNNKHYPGNRVHRNWKRMGGWGDP